MIFMEKNNDLCYTFSIEVKIMWYEYVLIGIALIVIILIVKTLLFTDKTNYKKKVEIDEE